MTALIVDDVAIMRVVLKDTLVGYCNFKKRDVFEASSGREALTIYKEKKPAIVFLDIAMPEMDGLETIRALRKIDADAKVVMCTSSGEESDVLDCIKAGAIDYVTKPPPPKRILQAVEKVLGMEDSDSDSDPAEKTEPQEKTGDDAAALKKKIELLEAELAALKNE